MDQTNKKSNNHWTKELVLASAKQFNGRAEWKKNASSAYKAAIRHGWLEESTAHMPLVKRVWNIELLKVSAAKYQSRGKWKENDPSAYKAALSKDLLDIVCSHMNYASKPDGYWTKEHVLESSLKYHSVAAWNAAETTALQRARSNGWMKEATAHMIALAMPIGPSIIHQFLLSHDIAYESERRFKISPEVANKPFDFHLPDFNLIIEYHGRQHLNGWSNEEESKLSIQFNDKVKKDWAIQNGFSFLEIKSWESKTEEQIINQIVDQLKSISNQRNLNLTLTARELSKTEIRKVQSGLVFDEDIILEEASKYQSRAEWMRCSPKTYRFALRHGLADIATRHMKYIVEHGKWTKEAVIESAKKYQTLMDWRLAESSAFVIACRNGWLNLARSHFTVTKQPNGYWTKERVIENAQKYNKLSEWRINESSASSIARRNGWTDEATAHMKKRVNRKSE